MSGKKIFWLSVLAIVILVFAVPAMRVALFPFFVANEAISSAEGIVDRTLDADNVIYNYEWFKLRWEKIEARRREVRITQQTYDDFVESAGPRENWDFRDKDEDARLRSVVLGNKISLEEMIAEYNARSKMMNRQIFKGTSPGQADLPIIVDEEGNGTYDIGEE